MRVDVVTAVHAAYARFLPAAWDSVRIQTHRDWRWYVQVDGRPAPVFDVLTRCGAMADERVLVAANGTREGPAVTRNIALGRSAAALVQNLDADDELEADAVALLSGALRTHRAAGFVVGFARDLLAGGELRDHDLPVRPGLLARGALVDSWITASDAYRLPVHPAGVMWRRSLLIHLGGWSALRGMEDTGTVMAASAVADGVLINAATLRYRKHPAQRSARRSKFTGGGGAYRAGPATSRAVACRTGLA